MSASGCWSCPIFVLAGAVLTTCGPKRLPSASSPEFADRPAVFGKPEYTLGVPPWRSATGLFTAYSPMLVLLSERLPFNLKFRTSLNHAGYHQQLRTGELDFALAMPDDAIEAEEWGYRIIAKAAGAMQGAVIVHADSGIRTIRQLSGKTLCYASPDDVAGAMLVKLHLKQRGLDVDRTTTSIYAGSAESCAFHVSFGLAAAAGAPMEVWANILANREQVTESLRLLSVTETLPGLAILARHGLPSAEVARLTEALLALQKDERAAGVLRMAGIPGFQRVSEGSYDPVWEFLQDYHRSFAGTPRGRPR